MKEVIEVLNVLWIYALCIFSFYVGNALGKAGKP